MRTLEKSAKKGTVSMILTVLLYAVGAASFPSAKLSAWFFSSDVTATLVIGTVGKILLSAFPVYLIFQFGFGKMFDFRGVTAVGLLLSVPAFVVAVDNFPFQPIFVGSMDVSFGDFGFVPYAAYCLAVGIMEEVIFRGLIFPLFMYKFKRTKKGLFRTIIVSSAVFGLMHLLNIIGGVAPFVIVQVVYSFLIGAMCALVLLFTGNIIFPILVHAVFDLGGLLYDFEFAVGKQWTAVHVAITAFFSIVCAAALITAFSVRDFDGVYTRFGLDVRPEEKTVDK